MNSPRRTLKTLALLALLGQPAPAAPAPNLNGVSGNIFKVDPKQQSFELLKETEYDPKTDLGKSRFTVYWTNKTTIIKLEERTSFSGIQGPVITDFHGIDETNSKTLRAGEPFVARVAIVHVGARGASGVDEDAKMVVDWFTPDPGENSKSGHIALQGKPVKVTMRKQHARIYVHEPLQATDLQKGFWKTSITGSEVDGRFLIERMEVSPLVDPRTIDDPKLPRVLVVGDSISMNYHNAAKSALEGVANYHRNDGNCFSTVHGVNNMELWLGNYQEPGRHWDVIQFNHGLHDLKQTYDNTTDSFGDYAVALEDYQKNLEKEIAIMKKTGAKLIWCATTPVPNSNKGQYARRKGAAREFNKAALEVMQKHPEIQINDLYEIVDGSPIFDNWRKGNDVHFRSAEQTALGNAVAEAVRSSLKGK